MKFKILFLLIVLSLFACSEVEETPEIEEYLMNEEYICNDCNLILIIIDTVRADHVSCYGYERETTPNIDKLAKSSHLFLNAYSQSSWTRSAIASIFSSKLPMEHGIFSERNNETLSSDIYKIQDFFEERNYDTAAIYSNPHLNFGLVENFDYTFYNKRKAEAKHIYDESLDWLKEHRNENFYLMIHNIDPHDSYQYHPEFEWSHDDLEYSAIKQLFPYKEKTGRSLCLKSDDMIVVNDTVLNRMKDNYDGEIAYVDMYIGKLIEYLEKNELMDNTIIVITSDHGEEFLDHGGYFHGCTLYNELIHVPMIIYLPGMEGTIIEEDVSTIDIFPTIASALQKRVELTGQDLMPLIEGKEFVHAPIMSATAFRGPLQYALIDPKGKLIKYANDTTYASDLYDYELGEIIGLYNLKNDIPELKDLSEAKPKLTNNLDIKLEKSIDDLSEMEVNDEIVEIDEDTLEQLKALGYMG